MIDIDEMRTESNWSWNYNHGKPFPWPCSKCGSLVKMEKNINPKRTMYVKCPKCGFKERSRN